jgi:hypothetical protein
MAAVDIKWTSATILAAIGDASRVSAPSTGSLLAPWCLQQYKLLNMLRWAFVLPDAGTTEKRQGDGEDDTGGTLAEKLSNAYDNAITDYNAAGWGAETDRLPLTYLSLTKAGGSPAQAHLENFRASFEYTHAGTSYQAVVMAVAQPTQYLSVDFASPDGYSEDTYVLFSSSGEQTISAGANQTEVMEQLPQDKPDPIGVGEWACALASSYVVLKFDGANGFAYKDW